jgi:hypothetical protein
MVSSKLLGLGMSVLQLISWHKVLQEVMLTGLCSFGTKVIEHKLIAQIYVDDIIFGATADS